ncbi:hypothetical protein LguiB_012902 [Lonicera macranthoides]
MMQMELIESTSLKLISVAEMFSNPTSDALSIAYALQCFELVASQVNFCNHYVLHLKMMEEMFEA